MKIELAKILGFLLIAPTVQSFAQEAEVAVPRRPSHTEVAHAIDILLDAGLLGENLSPTCISDVSVLRDLRESGLLSEEKARAMAICDGPAAR